MTSGVFMCCFSGESFLLRVLLVVSSILVMARNCARFLRETFIRLIVLFWFVVSV